MVVATKYEVAVDRSLCTGCGNCARVCPVGVYDIINDKAVPGRAELCMGCQLCEVECPVNAIVIGRPLGVPAPVGEVPVGPTPIPAQPPERPMAWVEPPPPPTSSEWPAQQPVAPLQPPPGVGADWPTAAPQAPPTPAPAPEAALRPVPKEGRRPGAKKLYAVKDLCVGCRVCEVMCSLHHNGTPSIYRARLRMALPEGNSFAYTPIICRHCKNPPPCYQACPVGAFYIDPNTEAAVIDPSKCISCLECVHACPFGAIPVSPDQREVLKCDLCGGDPACVKYCLRRPENLIPIRPYPETTVLRYDEPYRIAEMTRKLQTPKL